MLGGDLGSERREPRLGLEPGEDGSAGIVLGDLRDAEERHHAVAHELGDGAVLLVDDRLEEGVVAGHHLAGHLRIHSLAEARRAAEIAEDDGDGLAHRADRRHRGGLASRCGRAALIAEPRTVAKLHGAGPAALGETSTALTAEAGLRSVLRPAPPAPHPRRPLSDRAAESYRATRTPSIGSWGRRYRVKVRNDGACRADRCAVSPVQDLEPDQNQ